MATYTPHYNLKKPATSDKIRIADFNGNTDTIDTTMYNNESLIAKLKADIGIVENTNTATHNISAGQYVIWNGSLYTASSAISSGATLSTANLTAVSGGGLNALKTPSAGGDVAWNTTNVSGDNDRKSYMQMGNLVIASLEFTPVSGKISNGNVICTGLPTPRWHYWALAMAGNNSVKVSATGELSWYYPQNTSNTQRVDLCLVYFAE